MKSFIYSGILSLSLVLGITSCQYKDLDIVDMDKTVSLTILFDFTKLTRPPKLMRVAIYSLDRPETSPYLVDVKYCKTITLLKGAYQIAAYNNDSEINLAEDKNDKADSLKLYTDNADRRGITRNDSIDNVSYYDYPDSVVAAFIDTLALYDQQGQNSQIITIQPHEVTSHVHVTIKNIRNLSMLGSARISIEGVYRDYYVADHIGKEREEVNIIADGSLNSVTNEIKTNFNVFGFQRKENRILTLFLQGREFKAFKKYDVTEQIESQLSKKNIYIEIDGKLDIDDYVPKEPGFDIGVKDWEEKDIGIHI